MDDQEKTQTTNDIYPVISLNGFNEWVKPQIVARQQIDKKIQRLCQLLRLSYFGHRKHKAPQLDIRPTDISMLKYWTTGTSFPVDMLQEDLGGTANVYHQYISLFWDFPAGNKGYNRWGKLTKSYYLKPETEAYLTQQWRNGIAIPRNRKSGHHLRTVDFPVSGITKTSHEAISIRSLIPINSVRLSTLVSQEEETIHQLAVGNTRRFYEYRERLYGLRQLYVIQQWNTQLGSVPNLYRDKPNGNGRLYGYGQGHLQQMPRETRKRLASAVGWWDFDFRGCHYHILQSLCRAYGLVTPMLDDYLSDKDETERLLAEELELPIVGDKSAKVKGLMLAIMNDQQLSTSPYASLVDEIGKPAVALAQNSLYLKAIREEIRGIRQQVIKQHTHYGFIHNAVGKSYPLIFTDADTGKIKKIRPRRLLSRILMGYEAWALDVALHDQDDTVALMFDGWISENAKDTAALSNRIREQSIEKFGFPIHLDIKAVPPSQSSQNEK